MTRSLMLAVLLASSAIGGLADAADLTGRWEGRFQCRWRLGRTILHETVPEALMFVTQAGSDALHILLPSGGYDGRIHGSSGDPDRGTIGAERCLNDGEPAAGLDDVVRMEFKPS